MSRSIRGYIVFPTHGSTCKDCDLEGCLSVSGAGRIMGLGLRAMEKKNKTKEKRSERKMEEQTDFLVPVELEGENTIPIQWGNGGKDLQILLRRVVKEG